MPHFMYTYSPSKIIHLSTHSNILQLLGHFINFINILNLYMNKVYNIKTILLLTISITY